MTRTQVFLFLLLAVLVSGTSIASSQTLDPQSLVGEWKGTWTRVRGNPHLSGHKEYSGWYYLTIERVEGNQVYGRGEYAARTAESFNFQGTLDGNRLRFGKNVVTELQITDNHMEGQTTDGAKLSFTKQK
jgi:hypothetical protein